MKQVLGWRSARHAVLLGVTSLFSSAQDAGELVTRLNGHVVDIDTSCNK